MGNLLCCCRQKEGPDIAISNRSSCPILCNSDCEDRCSFMCCVVIRPGKTPQSSERTIKPLSPKVH